MVRAQAPSTSFDRIEEVKALGSGRVLIAGTIAGKLGAARFLNSGSPDLRFGNRGLAAVDADRTACSCSDGKAMTRDYQGRVIVAGNTFNRNGGGPKTDQHLVLTRLLPNGRLDKAFGRRGLAKPLPRRFLTTGVAIQRDGKIVVAGEMDNRFTVVRLESNGRLDRSFFNRGVFSRNISFLGGSALDVFVDLSGRIVTSGGISASEPSESALAVVRIIPR